jgi:pyruvate,water dikinase
MSAAAGARRGFPSPFEVPAPPGAAGWEEMYARHALFGEDRRAFEESRFWFQDSMHYAEPVRPFDALVMELCCAGLSHASARLFVIPGSLGLEYRVLNGYLYVSVTRVTDDAEIKRRAEAFARRAGHYYGHWEELYRRWRKKVERATDELETFAVPDLPAVEDESAVLEDRAGAGSGHELIAAYSRLIDGVDRVVHHHFEMLNLGYAAYVGFYEVCRRAFPGIRDEVIARMVVGADLLVLRPDDELRRLAVLATELGVGQAVRGADDEAGLRAALADDAAGERWLADFEQTKRPWFHFSYGNGLYSHHRSWIDDPALPIAAIGNYIKRLDVGEDIARSYETLLAERERIATEYRALLAQDGRRQFDESLLLARTVFPYVEDHTFYIEHHYLTLFWNKVRGFGALLAANGFLAEPDDVFYLRHDEVRAALEELRLCWSAGGGGAVRGPSHWPPTVTRRKTMLDAVREWDPPPALGNVPDEIDDPLAIMLYGTTPERVREWLAGSESNGAVRALTGAAGSPGVAVGTARVLLYPDALDELVDGEILVAPSTSPSWTPVFAKAAAAVLDVGGIMSHAAIVAREYGLPAVVGTGVGTAMIRTGDRLRVDGSTGLVTLLE